MTIKCFSEEERHQTKTAIGSAICFLYNIFCVIFIVDIKVYTVFFGKSGWLWKEPVLYLMNRPVVRTTTPAQQHTP